MGKGKFTQDQQLTATTAAGCGPAGKGVTQRCYRILGALLRWGRLLQQEYAGAARLQDRDDFGKSVASTVEIPAQ